MYGASRLDTRLQARTFFVLAMLVLTQVCVVTPLTIKAQIPPIDYSAPLPLITYDSISKLTFVSPQNCIDTLRIALKNAPPDAYKLGSQLNSLMSQAMWHKQAYHIDSILKYRRASVELAGASGDSLFFAEKLMHLASTMRYQSNYAEGERLIFEALELIERQGGGEKMQVDGLNALCNLCLASKDYSKAILYGKRAEKESYRLGFDRKRYTAQLCQVRALHRAHRDEEAIDFATVIFDEHAAGDTRDQMYIATVHAVIRGSNLRLADTNAAITNQRMVVEAELAQAKTSQSYETYYGARGRLALFEKRYTDAVKDLEIYYPYLKKNFPEGSINGGEYALALKKVGRVEEAYYIERESRISLDRIHRKELDAARQELRDTYRAREQEEQLAQRALELDKQKSTTRLIIGLAAALLISLIAVGVNFRKSRRQSHVLKLRSEENERLLKEVHHRVKNNLEIVSSLLELQADKLTDPEASKAIQAGRSRVLSIGLLHQKLYQDRAVGSVEMAGYLRDLAELLLQTYGAEKEVELSLKLASITFDLEQALPVGLIVNELVTNAMKYAFTSEAVGQLEVGFEETPNNTYRLWVADNGPGKTSDINTKGTGFGSELIRLLTFQLGGTLKEANVQGLLVEVIFGEGPTT